MSTATLPLTHRCQVLVVGGALAGVAAAAAAAAAGKRVLLVTAAPYLGDDLAATLRWCPGQAPTTALARRLLGPAGDDRPTPMQIKRGCEEHLLAAGVEFLYGCYPVAVARDAEDALSGVVVASRSGRFVVAAAEVIDATWRGEVARLAGASFTSFVPGDYAFERVVIGGERREHAAIVDARTDDDPVVITLQRGERAEFPVHRYTLRLPLAAASIDAFAAAEQFAATATYHPEQQMTADRLWLLPPERLQRDQDPLDRWTPDDGDLAAFCALPHLHVAGPAAAVDEATARQLAAPATACALGESLGRRLAERAGETRAIAGCTHAHEQPLPAGQLRSEQELRWSGTEQVPASSAVPHLDEVDVLVMGGGTAGASAAIAAARQGARTLVVEYQPQLGGVGTVGMIASYYFGNLCGFTAEIDAGVHELGPAGIPKNRWSIEAKQEWYRRELAAAGGRIWPLAIGCAAVRDGDRLTGVLVATPWGSGLVRARAVIDASGNADAAAHAGAETERVGAEHVAIQGAGLGPREPGFQYRNTDWTFADCDDVVDTTAAMVVARRKFADCFDVATLVDTRERRRVVGELSLGPLDFLASRTFRDTIVQAHSNFDTHGMTIHPLFLVEPPDKKPLDADVPLRCLLPRGLRGLVVTGLGKCAHRDALPVVRMQADVQNEGYAVGVASAWAAERDCDVREVDVRELQRHLVTVGVLAPEVPGQEDSPPPSEAELRAAIAAGCPDHLTLAMVFAHPVAALPLLRAALPEAEDELETRLALILGLLGDATGAGELATAIAAQHWDAGWNYRGMGQFGASASPLDALIIGLGRSGAREHAQVLVDKAAALGPDHDMSHSRALAEGLERLGVSEAAPQLARLLREPGVAGHHHHDRAAVAATVPASPTDNETRNVSLRELHLARALYRIGDHEGLGEAILRNYADDLRGPYARHARAVLAMGASVQPAIIT